MHVTIPLMLAALVQGPSCDPNDCNCNDIPDDVEIAQGFAQDLDGNGKPDECDAVACSPTDITTTGLGFNDPGHCMPDGQITGADLNYFVNYWVAGDTCQADWTTQGAGLLGPAAGVPDGIVTGADLNYFVNLWIIGCP